MCRSSWSVAQTCESASKRAPSQTSSMRLIFNRNQCNLATSFRADLNAAKSVISVLFHMDVTISVRVPLQRLSTAICNCNASYFLKLLIGGVLQRGGCRPTRVTLLSAADARRARYQWAHDDGRAAARGCHAGGFKQVFSSVPQNIPQVRRTSVRGPYSPIPDRQLTRGRRRRDQIRLDRGVQPRPG
jgi:hypothetical protein